AFDYAKDGRIGTYAERKSEDCDEGEPERFAEHTDGEAQILPQRFDKGFPARRADDFLRNFEIAPLQAHGAKRILAPGAGQSRSYEGSRPLCGLGILCRNVV